MKRDPKRFGKQVRASRLRQNLTLETVGRWCGVTHSYISQIEKAQKRPSLHTAIRLAVALGMPPRDWAIMSGAISWGELDALECNR